MGFGRHMNALSTFNLGSVSTRTFFVTTRKLILQEISSCEIVFCEDEFCGLLANLGKFVKFVIFLPIFS